MKKNINIQDVVILIAVASTTLYVVAYNLPPLISSFRFFWGPLALGIILFFRPALLLRRPIRLLLVYGVMVLGILQLTLWQYMSDWNVSQIRNEFYALLVTCFIWSYYWYYGEFDKFARLSKWTFLFIVITILSSHIALFIDPYVIRDSVNSFRREPERIVVLYRFGVAGYGYAQGLVLLIPCFVFLLRKKLTVFFNHKMLLLAFILLLLLVLRMQVFANLLVGTTLTVLSLMGSKRVRSSYFAIGVFVLLLVLIPIEFYSEGILFVSNFFQEGTAIHVRLIDFADFIIAPDFEGETQAGGRAARYPLLFEAFVLQPFLGDASHDSALQIGAGGHLYWMNRLTVWGVLGFGFFIFMLYRIYQSIVVLFDSEFRYYYNLSVFGFVLFGLMKAIGGREPWLMLIVVIPGLYCLYRKQKDLPKTVGGRKSLQSD